MRVLLLGLGRIGFACKSDGKLSLASHLGAILSNDYFNLKMVCEPRDFILKKVSEEYDIVGVKSLEEIDQNEEFDLIVIASSTDTHANMIREAIKFKPKVIFTEKPLAQSSEDAIFLKQLCENNKIQLIVNFSRRFSKLYQNIRKEVKSLPSNVKKTMLVKFTGSIKNNGIHFIDLSLFFWGEPKTIMVSKTKNGVIKSFSFFYDSEKAEVHYTCLGNMAASVEEIDIFFGDKRYMIDNHGVVLKTVCEDPIFPGFKLYGEQKNICDDSSESLVLAYENIKEWERDEFELMSLAQNTTIINKIVDVYLDE